MGGKMLGPDNALWDDGEWVSWDDINRQIQYKEWGAKYPNADRGLIPVFENLLAVAEDYFFQTGSHLQVYGDIGELFGAITHGIKLHSNYAAGSDGRLGNDFVEVKTITPFKKNDVVTVKARGHFSKLLVVKIDQDFDISSRMIDRKKLPAAKQGKITIRWDDIKTTN
jgi:hypothetical protein